MPTVLDHLAAHGYLTTTRWLHDRGHSDGEINRLVQRGLIVRPARGWVAARGASQLAVLAVAHRGKLAGSAALATRQIWDACDSRVHVARRPSSHGSAALLHPVSAFSAPRFPAGPVREHWVTERWPDEREPPWRTSVIDALHLVSRTAPPDQFVACVDSALHTAALSRAGLPTLRALLAIRSRPLLDAVTAKSESGLESLSRFRLTGLVRSIEVQVPMPGIAISGRDGRVDLVLDGWLVLELDGDQFHDPRVDRRRDGILIRRGYRVLHLGYEQVVNDWAATLAIIFESLRYPPR